MSVYPKVRSSNGGRDWYEDEGDDRFTSKVVPADAIVIERSTLPVVSVTEVGSMKVADTVFCGYDESMLRRDVLQRLALAEHLKAQVEALATALKDEPMFGLGRPDADIIARSLIAQGWSK